MVLWKKDLGKELRNWNKMRTLSITFLLIGIAFCYLPIALPGQQNIIDSLQNVIKNSTAADTSKVITLIDLAWELKNIGEYEKTRRYCNQAASFAEKIGYKKGKATSLNVMGVSYMDQGNYGQALKLILAALTIREEIGDKKGTSACYNNIGIIYEEQGNYIKSLENYFTSLKIREGLGDKKGMADSYNNMGTLYELQGNYNEALKNYSMALEIEKIISGASASIDTTNIITFPNADIRIFVSRTSFFLPKLLPH